MKNGPFTFDQLFGLVGNDSRRDVACPLCGPAPGRTATNRKRAVLRIWHPEPGFVTFYCSRCDTGGYAVDDGREPLPQDVLEKICAKAEAFDREQATKKLETARWLWSSSRPIVGTPAERYV